MGQNHLERTGNVIFFGIGVVVVAFHQTGMGHEFSEPLVVVVVTSDKARTRW